MVVFLYSELSNTHHQWDVNHIKAKTFPYKRRMDIYNPDSFETCHTHIRHKRVALKIKYFAEYHEMPKSRDKSFEIKNGKMQELYEEQRLIEDTNNIKYIELQDKMFELSESMKVPKNIEVISNEK